MFYLSNQRGQEEFSQSSPMREHGVVGQYLLGRRLDDGRTNEIYEATCSGIHGRAVTRFLRRALRAGPQAAEACRHDLDRLTHVRHVNLASGLASGITPEGVPYLVREHIEGETLGSTLARGKPVDPDRAVAIVRAIASALAAVHEAGVIHGDLRPSKVFLAPAPGGRRMVKVVGFGTWRLGGDRQGPGVMAEPARFTSPELTRGEAVDGRADQFALAAIAYRLIAGEDAFAGDDVAAVLRDVLTGAPRPLAGIPDLGPEVESVIRRGLARRPEDRYATVLDFATALDRAVTGRPAETTEPVSSAEILSMASIAGALPEVEMGKEADETFFDVGKLQEVDGWQFEMPPGYRRARRKRPSRLGLIAVLSLSAAGLWWVASAPTAWTPTAVWQALAQLAGP
jgi:eukaryotic-like serine/threonine-protein kinase